MALRISSAPRPILCAVLDGTDLGPTPERVAMRLFSAGVDWIQLRDRELESDALLAVAVALVSAARNVSDRLGDGEREHPDTPRVLINRRTDIALAAGADGVHLGFDAIDAPSARALLGSEALIGASFHSAIEVERAMAAAEVGALSYAHLAPIWDPISKAATRPPLGTEVLSQAAAFGLPLLAQGGIDAERSALAIRAGAAGIAVTGQLSKAEDPATVAEQLRKSLDPPSSPAGDISRNQSPPGGDRGPMP